MTSNAAKNNNTNGRLVVLEHSSRILADNPLGDPMSALFPSGCRLSTMPAEGYAVSRCSSTWWATPAQDGRIPTG